MRKEALPEGRALWAEGTASTKASWGQHEALQRLRQCGGPWGHTPLLIHPVTMQQGLLSTYYVLGASGLGCGTGAQMVNRGTTRILHPDRGWEDMRHFPEDGES